MYLSLSVGVVISYAPRCEKTGLRGFPTRPHTNQAVQLQNMSRGLKFHILEVEELYHLCSENKGADQLRGYREADRRLCFRICKKPVFSQRGSYVTDCYLCTYFSTIARLCRFRICIHPSAQAPVTVCLLPRTDRESGSLILFSHKITLIKFRCCCHEGIFMFTKHRYKHLFGEKMV